MKKFLNRTSTIFLVAAIGMLSCKEDEVKSSTLGRWSIDTIAYNGVDVRACLNINILHLEKEYCTLPELLATDCGVTANYTAKDGSWSITEKSPLYLSINANNDIFRGKYDVKFIDDTVSRMLIMELTSKKTRIKCRKGLSNYESNRELIQELVRLSNKASK